MEMICKNCGGKFDKDELVCPYCGFENFEQAVDEQQDYIDDYNKKTSELKKEPKRIARFSGKVILMMAGAVLVLFLTALGIASLIRVIRGDVNLGNHKEDIAILEEYYNQGKYKELSEYLDKLEAKYSDSYEKYYIVYNMYDDYLFLEDSTRSNAELYIDYAYEDDGELLEYSLYCCCENLANIYELRENGYVYGEEEAAEDFEKKFRSLLSENFRMTDEEIEEAIHIFDGEYSTYEELCKKLSKRLSTGGDK